MSPVSVKNRNKKGSVKYTQTGKSSLNISKTV